MRKLITTAAVLAALTSPTIAQESSNKFEGAYAGAMIGGNSYSFDGLADDVDGLTFGGLLGYRVAVTDGVLIGIEGFVNSNEANKDFGFGIKFNSDASYGFNATVGYAVDNIMSFAMLGYGWNDLSFSGLDLSDSDDGLHVAVGVEFKLTRSFNLRVQADYQDFFRANYLGGSAGIIFRF